MVEIRHINPQIKLGILDLNGFSQSKSITQKREIEKAGAQFLLTTLLNTTNFEIEYTPTNKPFLKDREEHISISHSHSKLVVIMNDKYNTGVDIELIRDKILNIKHKFLNDTELFYAKNDIETLTFMWATKEVLYKIHGLKGLDFKTNLAIEIKNNDTFLGHIITSAIKKTYLLQKEKLQNYCLVYALNEV